MKQFKSLHRQAGKLGGGSRSTTQQQDSDSQTIDTRNLDLADSQDAIAAGGDLRFDQDIETRIEVEDSEAIAAARDIADGALALSTDVTAQAIRASGDNLRDSLDFGQGNVREALDFGGDALSTTETAVGTAFDFGRDAIRSTQDTLANITRTSVDTLRGAVTSAADATRSDSANVLNNAVKFGAAAVVGIAVIALLARR